MRIRTAATIKVGYHGGPKYPHLEQVDGTPDLIGEIVRAHS